MANSDVRISRALTEAPSHLEITGTGLFQLHLAALTTFTGAMVFRLG
jgi:hypothetical protein